MEQFETFSSFSGSPSPQAESRKASTDVYLTIYGMTRNEINLPTEAEVRVAYHEGEEAVVELFHQMNEIINQLIGRIQALEN